MRRRYPLGILVSSFIAHSLLAYDMYPHGYHKDNYRDVRALGRGNTGVATITDGNAAFYNPGGLALAQSYNVTLVNSSVGGGQNIVDSFTELKDATKDSNTTLNQKFSPFLGKPLGLEGSLFPYISVPRFMAGFWDYFKMDMTYRNPVNPEIEIDGRNDYGLVTGFAVPVVPGLGVGASARYQRRRAANARITGATVLSGSGSTLEDTFVSGEAFALNVGVQWKRTMSNNSFYALGMAIEDLGDTKFRNQKLNGRPPLAQKMAVNFGSAFGFSSTLVDGALLFDMRHANHRDLSYTKKFFMGTELSLPVVDLRGGFFQGYWTAGATIKILPLFDLDVTTYGEELDSAAGIRQNRVWMLGLRAGLAIKKQGDKKVSRQRAILNAL